MTSRSRAWNSGDPNNQNARAAAMFRTLFTEAPGGHWLWHGPRNHWGEPVFGEARQHAYISAHWLVSRKQIPGGYVRACEFADCVSPKCWRPAIPVRAVRPKPKPAPRRPANTTGTGIRGVKLVDMKACPKGHPFPDNLHTSGVRPYCRACRAKNRRDHAARKRAS